MITSLAQIKAFINVPANDTSQDNWLSSLQFAAESVVKNHIGQQLEQQTYTHFFAGNRTRYLTLRERPVLSITSVYEDFAGNYGFTDGAFPATTLLTPGVDYALRYDGTLPDTSTACAYAGLLVRIPFVWPMLSRAYRPNQLYPDGGPVLGNVKVTYVAGYATVPQDLQVAVATLVASMKRTVPMGGTLESERIGDYSYQLAFPRGGAFTYPEIGAVRQMLSKYKDTPW